jgi:hypothetical protein
MGLIYERSGSRKLLLRRSLLNICHFPEYGLELVIDPRLPLGKVDALITSFTPFSYVVRSAGDRLRSLEVQGMYPVHDGDDSSPYKRASRILSRDQLVIGGTTSRCFGSSTRGSHSASPVGDASLVPFAPEARDGLPLATHDAASLVKSMPASCHKGLVTTCFHLTFGSHSQLGHTNERDDRKDGFMLSSARRTSRLDSASGASNWCGGDRWGLAAPDEVAQSAEVRSQTKL